MANKLRIRCVVIDDIDFTPEWVEATAVDVKVTDEVGDLVAEVQKKTPTLQQYELGSFRVLRILKPVSAVAADADANTSEIKKKLRGKGEDLSLDPILQRLHEQTREAKKTVLANEYVQVLSHEFELGGYFKHEEKKCVSAILVRLTTLGELSVSFHQLCFTFPFTPRRESREGSKKASGIGNGLACVTVLATPLVSTF